MSRTVIVLIDSVFPFEEGEPFLENEFQFLKESCDFLIIAPTAVRLLNKNRIIVDSKTDIIENKMVTSKWKRILLAGIAILDADFWHEIVTLIRCRQFSYGTLKTLLIFVSNSIRSIFLIRKELSKQLKCDDNIVFYSYWLDTNAYIAGKLKQSFKGSKSISRGHGFDIYLERNEHKYIPLRNEVFRGLDLICPISEDGVTYLAMHYPDIIHKLSLSRLGTIDHGMCVPGKHDRLVIVSCSNIIPVKRIERLIDALSLLTNEEIEWIHFGTGILKKEIQDYAMNQLMGKVKFNFIGAVDNSELMKWYRINPVDVFVNVSESEGIPVSIMEAMSFGIPCIATDVGGTAEIVEDGVNGYLISSNEHTSKLLAEKLLLMINQGEKEKGIMRNNARHMWEEKYSAEINYQDFYKLVMKI